MGWGMAYKKARGSGRGWLQTGKERCARYPHCRSCLFVYLYDSENYITCHNTVRYEVVFQLSSDISATQNTPQFQTYLHTPFPAM